MPTIALVAGEASGDIHAANLLRALTRLDASVEAWAVGGEALRDAGAEIVYPTEAISGMGLVEAVGRLPSLVRARRTVLDRFTRCPPDLFIPVDFGGLNLRLARAARARGIPVVYYIPPKVWAWGAWRMRHLRASVDEALVTLPFEEPFLRARGVPSTYVGSPVLDHLAPRRFEAEPETVGLLPGSREGEVSRIWPVLLGAADRLARGRRLRFLVPLAPGLRREALEAALARHDLDVQILGGGAQEVMERARLCLVTSGTATLECALVGTPMVVVYTVNWLTYALGRVLLRVTHIALPNLIAGREVVPECVQASSEDIAARGEPLLEDGEEREAMMRGLREVREAVGSPGASRRAARRVLGHLRRELAEVRCT